MRVGATRLSLSFCLSLSLACLLSLSLSRSLSLSLGLSYLAAATRNTATALCDVRVRLYFPQSLSLAFDVLGGLSVLQVGLSDGNFNDLIA